MVPSAGPPSSHGRSDARRADGSGQDGKGLRRVETALVVLLPGLHPFDLDARKGIDLEPERMSMWVAMDRGAASQTSRTAFAAIPCDNMWVPPSNGVLGSDPCEVPMLDPLDEAFDHRSPNALPWGRPACL